jgi:threonine/homoserine/homoserine lactone efflux protein
MNFLASGPFLMSATALLGSPGPAIAALLVVGRVEGLSRGLRYYAGLQIGLAVASATCAAGLLSLLRAIPSAIQMMTILSTVYLLYLAYKIATSPVGSAPRSERIASSTRAGILLGLTNPKAYVAFATLFASQTIVSTSQAADMALKWVLCVLVMIIVDIAWLFVGVALNQAAPRPVTERILNVSLGAMILGAAALAFI